MHVLISLAVNVDDESGKSPILIDTTTTTAPATTPTTEIMSIMTTIFDASTGSNLILVSVFYDLL